MMIRGVPGTPEDHARTIVRVVKDRGLPREVAVIALMTAITESGIRALINPNDPASLTYPHDGVGYDHDSVGIFQQRPPWGSVEQRLDPATTTGLFLDRLQAWGWTDVTPWAAAQRVQVSAFADGSNYKANYQTAKDLAYRLWAELSTGGVLGADVNKEDDMGAPISLAITGGPGGDRGWIIGPAGVVEATVSEVAAAAALLGATVQRTGTAAMADVRDKLAAVLR